MSDRIPPVAPEGCAWMPWRASDQVDVVCARWTGGRWEHRRWAYLSAPGSVLDFQLMRRLGQGECRDLPYKARYLGPIGWVEDVEAGREVLRWSNDEHPPPLGWYAPVRFAGEVPDFGEGGLRLVDESEVVDEHGCVPTEQGPALPIYLPPLPKPEREEPATVSEALRLQIQLREVEAERDEAVAAYERAQRVIEMRTAERDEAQIELERVREAARARAEPDGPIETTEVRLLRDVFRRIADGEV